MAATNFTPISLYYSTTASAVPSAGNLVAGELALNTADMKLYAKNSAGTVTLLASNAGASGSVTSVSGTGTVNGLTLTGTVTTSGSLTLGGTLSLVSPPAIGSTSPNTGAFTTLSATTSAEVNGTYPKIYLIETDAATDNKQWWFESNAGVYQARVLNDAISVATTWLSATRSGATITQVALNASTGGVIHQQINGTNIATVSSTGLGIGTTTPNALLSFGTSVTNKKIFLYEDATDAYGFGIAGGELRQYVPSSAGITFGKYNISTNTFTEQIRMSANGGFGVGTSSNAAAGDINATGNITAFFSDKRLKTISGKIQNALDKVGKLSGVYYTFNDLAKSFGYDSDEEHVGVIAQEVEAVLPQIIKAAPFDLDENNNSKSGQNYKTVQYDKLTPLLIEAINELRAEVTALKGAI
jgi:hypothetical protein